MSWILVMLIYTNNPFYGNDQVPTISFQTKASCEEFLAEMKTKKGQANGYCLQKKD